MLVNHSRTATGSARLRWPECGAKLRPAAGISGPKRHSRARRETASAACSLCLVIARGGNPVSTAGMTPDSTFDDQTAKYARVAFWVSIAMGRPFLRRCFSGCHETAILARGNTMRKTKSIRKSRYQNGRSAPRLIHFLGVPATANGTPSVPTLLDFKS